MKSYVGALENLRLARDNLQIAQGMFKQEYLDEMKARKFFNTLMITKRNINEALGYFENE